MHEHAAVLDSMVQVIAPEMPRQMVRWGGNMAGWENELQELRDFIDALRRRSGGGHGRLL